MEATLKHYTVSPADAFSDKIERKVRRRFFVAPSIAEDAERMSTCQNPVPLPAAAVRVG